MSPLGAVIGVLVVVISVALGTVGVVYTFFPEHLPAAFAKTDKKKRSSSKRESKRRSSKRHSKVRGGEDAAIATSKRGSIRGSVTALEPESETEVAIQELKRMSNKREKPLSRLFERRKSKKTAEEVTSEDEIVSTDDEQRGSVVESPRKTASKKGTLASGKKFAGALAGGMGALVAAPVVASAFVGGKAFDSVKGVSLPTGRKPPSPRRKMSHRASIRAEQGDEDGLEKKLDREMNISAPLNTQSSWRSNSLTSVDDMALYDEEPVLHHRLLKCTLKTHEGHTSAIAFSPSGQYVATAGTDGSLRLSFRKTFQKDASLIRTHDFVLPDEDYASSLMFSSGTGHYLAVGTAKHSRIHIYRVYRSANDRPQLERTIETGHTGRIKHLFMLKAPSSLEMFLISGTDSRDDTGLKFWSFGKKSKVLFTNKVKDLKCILRVRISKDAKTMLVLGKTEDKSRAIKIFDVLYSNRGTRNKVWTVNRVEPSPATDSLGEMNNAKDIAFAQRSNAFITVSKGWDVAKVRDGRLVHNIACPPTSDDVAPFLAAAIAETHGTIITARGGDIYLYKIPETRDAMPELVTFISAAHAMDISEIIVSPEEDSFLTTTSTSRAARLWKLE